MRARKASRTTGPQTTNCQRRAAPKIITASVRTPNHVTQAALMGADIATVPFAALKKCVHHPLADQGLVKFAADWKKVVEG